MYEDIVSRHCLSFEKKVVLKGEGFTLTAVRWRLFSKIRVSKSRERQGRFFFLFSRIVEIQKKKISFATYKSILAASIWTCIQLWTSGRFRRNINLTLIKEGEKKDIVQQVLRNLEGTSIFKIVVDRVCSLIFLNESRTRIF